MALIDNINDGFRQLATLVKGKVDKTAVIDLAHGGTGAATATQARKNIGTIEYVASLPAISEANKFYAVKNGDNVDLYMSDSAGTAFYKFTTSQQTINGLSIGDIITQLFANNEQGFAFDFNDLSTMYQDAAGTIPVTGVGQPVGKVLDKSGRGNHAFQTTSASRPILRQNAVTGANYLEFDGTDDFLQTNNIDFTATDKVSLFAGVRKLSDTAQSIIGLGPSPDTANGTFEILRGTAGSQFGTILRGTVNSGNYITNSIYAAPISAVLSAKLDISGSIKQSLRINNILAGSSTVSVGTGNYGNRPLYIGRRGGTSLPFNGHIYNLIGIARLVTDTEISNTETVIAKNVGVTL